MALVLRILDEIPRTPLRRATSWCLSKRPQMSVSRQSQGLSPGHRRLRFSFQINDFKDPEPEDRSHRLAPGCGGGGDVVASLSRVKRSFRRRTSFQRPRPKAREALFSASFSCVKWFFLKKNLCLQTTLAGRRRRLSKEGRSPCQPGFSAILRGLKSEDFGPQKTVWKAREARLCFVRRFDWSAEANRNTLRKQPAFATFFPGNRWRFSSPWPRRPARFRARRRYTQRPFGPQPDSFRIPNFLADSRSMDGRPARPAPPGQPAAI